MKSKSKNHKVQYSAISIIKNMDLLYVLCYIPASDMDYMFKNKGCIIYSGPGIMDASQFHEVQPVWSF